MTDVRLQKRIFLIFKKSNVNGWEKLVPAIVRHRRSGGPDFNKGKKKWKMTAVLKGKKLHLTKMSRGGHWNEAWHQTRLKSPSTCPAGHGVQEAKSGRRGKIMESEDEVKRKGKEKVPSIPPPLPANPDRFLPHTLEESDRFFSIGPCGHGC